MASPVVTFPDLPPPSYYENVSYRSEWQKLSEEASNTNQTVLDAAWHGPHLVACTASGDIAIWHVPEQLDQLDEEDEEQDNDDSSSVQSFDARFKKRRALVVRISHGALYTIQICTLDSKSLLIVSGDEGVWTYDWKEWLHFLKSRRRYPNVLALFQPHPSIRGTAVYDCDVRGNILYAAAGDGFGCYKWDMATQQLVATYSTKRNGQGYAVRARFDDTVLVGGSDGCLALWDGAKDELIEHIDVKSVFGENKSLVTTEAAVKQPWGPKTNLWISDLSATSNDWWTVSGGAQYPRTGFLATWHVPTRSLIAACVTRETPQRMSRSGSCLITVADEGVVSHWNPTQLTRTGRFWCTSPSSYAVAVRQTDECAVIGGVGPHLDVFQNLTDRSFTLKMHDPRHKK